MFPFPRLQYRKGGDLLMKKSSPLCRRRKKNDEVNRINCSLYYSPTPSVEKARRRDNRKEREREQKEEENEEKIIFG